MDIFPMHLRKKRGIYPENPQSAKIANGLNEEFESVLDDLKALKKHCEDLKHVQTKKGC